MVMERGKKDSDEMSGSENLLLFNSCLNLI